MLFRLAGENTNAADYVLYPEIIKTGSDIEIWAIGKMVSVCNDVVDILQSREAYVKQPQKHSVFW